MKFKLPKCIVTVEATVTVETLDSIRKYAQEEQDASKNSQFVNKLNSDGENLPEVKHIDLTNEK